MPESNEDINKCFIYHKWKLVKNTGKILYRECEICGLRRGNHLKDTGYEKMNDDWLHHRSDDL